MTLNAHAFAMTNLLAAQLGPPPLVWFDGAVPDGTSPPYVVVYFADADPEQPDSRALDGMPHRYVQRAYAHSVGGNAAAARAVAERVRAAWLNVVPSVAGRVCFPIRREDGGPPQRDESAGGLLMDKTDIYRLESEPA